MKYYYTEKHWNVENILLNYKRQFLTKRLIYSRKTYDKSILQILMIYSLWGKKWF